MGDRGGAEKAAAVVKGPAAGSTNNNKTNNEGKQRRANTLASAGSAARERVGEERVARQTTAALQAKRVIDLFAEVICLIVAHTPFLSHPS